MVDVQPSFTVPSSMIDEIASLAKNFYTVATVERHDEAVTPFERQLGWKPGINDECLIPAHRTFIKHGYLPPAEAIRHLKERAFERVLAAAHRLIPAAWPRVSCSSMQAFNRRC